jgi:hypothetical protein
VESEGAIVLNFEGGEGGSVGGGDVEGAVVEEEEGAIEGGGAGDGERTVVGDLGAGGEVGEGRGSGGADGGGAVEEEEGAIELEVAGEGGGVLDNELAASDGRVGITDVVGVESAAGPGQGVDGGEEIGEVESSWESSLMRKVTVVTALVEMSLRAAFPLRVANFLSRV